MPDDPNDLPLALILTALLVAGAVLWLAALRGDQQQALLGDRRVDP